MKTYNLKDNISGADVDGCSLSITESGSKLHFAFDVRDKHIFCPYGDNQNVYDGDAVEIFISGDGERSRYLELELSPHGARFYAKITNELDDEPTIRAQMLPYNGFAANAALTDYGYTAEIILDVQSIPQYDRSSCVFNAFRLDYDANGELVALQALSPTYKPRFHFPQFFVRLADCLS